MIPVRVESVRVTIVRRRRRKWVFAALLAVLCLLPLLNVALLVLTFIGLMYGSIVFLATPAEPNLALAIERKEPGFLEVSDGFVTARSGAREVTYAAEEIEEGWIASYWGQHVVLQLAGGDLLAAELSDPASGDAILAAAKVRADQRTLDTKLAPSNWMGATVAALIGLVWSIGILGYVGLRYLAARSVSDKWLPLATVLVVLAALSYRCILVLLPKKLSVGTDGLSIKNGLKRVFIPYGDVTRLEIEARGVRVHQKSRRDQKTSSLLLPCWGIAQRALHDRIHQAMAVGSGELAAEAKQRLLDREGLSLVDWRQRLRDLGLGRSAGGGYRSVALEQEDLAHVLENSSASPERRIAAALALSATGGADVKLRVRAVVSACANEHLRIAIERAAEGEIEEADLELALGVGHTMGARA